VSNHSGYKPSLVFRQDAEPGSVLRRITGIRGNFPQVIIAGAQKSGTTSLYAALASHPDFQSPQLKEPFYYGNDDRYCKGKEHYLMNFPGAQNGKFTVDASTNYLDHKLAASRILQDNPEAKTVIILRDPVFRAFSHYRMQKKIGAEELSFIDALRLEDQRIEEGNSFSKVHNYCYQRLGYRSRGEYSRMIGPWLAAFDKNRIHFINAESFFSFPEREYERLLDFLQVRSHPLQDNRKFNEGQQGEITTEAMDLLVKHYRERNLELSTMVGAEITRNWVC